MNRRGVVAAVLACLLSLGCPLGGSAQVLPDLAPSPGPDFSAGGGPSGACASGACATDGCPSPAVGGAGCAEAPWAPADIPAAHCWASVEYCCWWLQDSPSVPLIAASGASGTAVFFGGPVQEVDYGLTNAGRGSVGFTTPDGWGLECDFLFTEQQFFDFAAGTTGDPTLAVPVYSTTAFGGVPVGETAYVSGGAPLGLDIDARIQFWSCEINGLLNLVNGQNFRLGMLGGCRYFNLRERFALNSFAPDDVNIGHVSTRDAYTSDNDLWGGTMGLRSQLALGPVSLDVIAKCTVGNNHQVYTAAGSTSVANGAFGYPTGVIESGLLVMPSNTGRFAQDTFCYLPEGQVRIGFSPTKSIRFTAGYTLLYLSDVVRASAQVNRVVNLTQNPVLSGSSFTGSPTLPAPFSAQDFWAHGMTFGCEFSY